MDNSNNVVIDTFYSMIESIYNQGRKIEVDIIKYAEQCNEINNMVRERSDTIICQFTEADKVFEAASLQKYLDQFTETQKKSIEMWKKQIQDSKQMMVLLLNEHEDKKVEFSNDMKNNSANKKDNIAIEQLKSHYNELIQYLQEDNDSLKYQLDAANNKLAEMWAHYQKMQKEDEEEILFIESGHKNTIQELLDEQHKVREIQAELEELRAFKARYEQGCGFSEPDSTV